MDYHTFLEKKQTELGLLTQYSNVPIQVIAKGHPPLLFGFPTPMQEFSCLPAISQAAPQWISTSKARYVVFPAFSNPSAWILLEPVPTSNHDPEKHSARQFCRYCTFLYYWATGQEFDPFKLLPHFPTGTTVPNCSLPVQKCFAYIREHLNESISLLDLSHAAGLTSPYLSVLFKKETGRSLVEEIHQQKIERAKQLLTQTDLSILEICNSLSFCSQSYFTQIFRQHSGLTPKAYRAQQLASPAFLYQSSLFKHNNEP